MPRPRAVPREAELPQVSDALGAFMLRDQTTDGTSTFPLDFGWV